MLRIVPDDGDCLFMVARFDFSGQEEKSEMIMQVFYFCNKPSVETRVDDALC
jgi:hypothetical protein